MRAYERLIQYVQIHTSSREGAEQTPSTERQFELSRVLEKEMKVLGLADVHVDEHAYVYGVLPATPGLENRPCIALIAHLDTIPDEDFSGENVKPQMVPNYDGGELRLGHSGRVLSPDQFPDLKVLKGHTLITTEGTTVLGADDKAGISEIMTACEELITEKLPHRRISICFTPDEEIGHGAALLSLERLGADFAFTVDGGDPAEVNFETFNAAAARVEFEALLPAAERPERTENYEGFFHLLSMKGGVEEAELSYIIRDHDAAHFEARKETMRQAAKFLNERYGENTVKLELRDQYRNMAEVLSGHMDVVGLADAALRKAGLEPKHVPIRGGTDGSQLSARGLPCPNLGTGGACFHGPYEHISVENMDLMVKVLKNLVCE